MKKAVSGAKNSAGLVRSRAKPPPSGEKIARWLKGGEWVLNDYCTRHCRDHIIVLPLS